MLLLPSVYSCVYFVYIAYVSFVEMFSVQLNYTLLSSIILDTPIIALIVLSVLLTVAGVSYTV